MIELGVNIDHIATVRQARRTYEPDPVWAAVEAQLGGADGITVHLREDRRHIQDDDVLRLHQLTQIKLNLEMAATEEMIGIARRIRPQMAMLVPEGRHEITTEGGLDVVVLNVAPILAQVRRDAIGAGRFANGRGGHRIGLVSTACLPNRRDVTGARLGGCTAAATTTRDREHQGRQPSLEHGFLRSG